MTPPRDKEDDGARRNTPQPAPLAGTEAARHVAHLTGMTPESALAFVAFHSGLRSIPRRDGD